MSSRTANTFPELKDIDIIIDKIESIKLPTPREGYWWNKHRLRLRAVYYDNKHGDYRIFVDYLFPHDEPNESVLQTSHFETIMENATGLYRQGAIMWQIAFWDLRYVKSMNASDNFHEDHRDYYEPFMDNFKV